MDTTEIRLQALITRREAMLQANRERESHGYADAYGEDSFTSLENGMLALCPPPEITATLCPRCEANAELHRRCPEHQPEDEDERSEEASAGDAVRAEVKRLRLALQKITRVSDPTTYHSEGIAARMFDIAQHALGEGAPDGALPPATAAQGDGDPAAPSLTGPCPGDDRPAWRREVGELLAAMTPGTNAGRIAQILNAHLAEDAAREKRHRKLREEAWVVPKHFDKCNLRPWHIKALRAALEEDEDV